MALLHANCVEWEGIGVLLRGRSGVGKSDLTLRLLNQGATLVSDDYVNLSAQGDALIAETPPAIAGLLEVRGMGILRVGHLGRCHVRLAMDLDQAAAAERLPEPRHETFEGVAIPVHGADPMMSSAVARVRLAVDLARGRIERVA